MNDDSVSKVHEEQKSLCGEQGVGSIEGKGKSSKHEGVGEPKSEMGHGSASSGGVAGKYIPGGKGASFGGTKGY